MIPQALIFDVFGTLVDWRSGIAAALAPVLAEKGIAADPAALADAWRAEYDPGMARVRDGARGYVALDLLHRENLDRMLDRAGLASRFPEAERETLAHAWERLPAWPDVGPGLDALRPRFLLAPCSNGSIALMARLARYAGLRWDCILGADIARDYKPKPQVYRAAVAALGLEPGAVMMVAAHAGDLVAARGAGLKTAFIPRPLEHGAGGRAEEAPEGTDVVAPDLPALATLLGAGGS